MPLHDEAAPADDRKADGRRCGNCAFHQKWGAHSYPKCGLGDGCRFTHGQGTDCRAWWPGCRDHQYTETADEDAALGRLVEDVPTGGLL